MGPPAAAGMTGAQPAQAYQQPVPATAAGMGSRPSSLGGGVPGLQVRACSSTICSSFALFLVGLCAFPWLEWETEVPLHTLPLYGVCAAVGVACGWVQVC
jgi:hypothetical protein